MLGTRNWPGRSRTVLQAEDEPLRINAGLLQGLTPHSLLAVYPPPGQPRPKQPLGYVRITECRRLDATVAPAAYDGLPADTARLPDGGVCELALVDYGELRLRVGVAPVDFVGQPVAAAVGRRLREELSSAVSTPEALFCLATAPAPVDWFVQGDANCVYVVPATGVPVAETDGRLPAPFGPAPLSAPLSDWLRDRLQQIARFENLKRLAAGSDETSHGSGALRVELELRRSRDQADREGQPVHFEAGLPTFHAGDRVDIRIRNPQRFPLDVTLLYLDCGFGITPLFPVDGELNRLEPGGEKLVRVVASTTTPGLEHVAVIGVRGSTVQPADFSVLGPRVIKIQAELFAHQELRPRLEEVDDGLSGERPARVIWPPVALKESDDLFLRPRPERRLVVLVGVLDVPPRPVSSAVK
ncbi:MAG: hypothetical protein NTY19_48600 [Planctomycetota bacterium]|nr:hypothetical protein [Planctomycetota bacterium]